SHVVPISVWSPPCAITRLVSSSLVGVCPLTACGTPSLWAAHCSHRCFSIFLPFLISVRWTVACLLQLSHFNSAFLQRGHRPCNQWYFGTLQASMKKRKSRLISAVAPSGGN